LAINAPKLSVRLPEGQEVEVVLIRLPDGRVIARTREEIEAAQQKGPQGVR